MATLFSSSHLLKSLHAHHVVWGGGGSDSQLCRCPAESLHLWCSPVVSSVSVIPKEPEIWYSVAGQPVTTNVLCTKTKWAELLEKKADFFHQWLSQSLPQDLQVSISQAEPWAVSVEHGWEWANQGGAEGVCSWGKWHECSQPVPAGKLKSTLWPQALLYLVLIVPLSISCMCQAVVPAWGQESHARVEPQCSVKWG